MKVLIDTNIIIDYLADRMPFADHAEQVLAICESGEVDGLITANAITDIYYVVSKVASREKTLEAIWTLCSILDIVDVGLSCNNSDLQLNFRSQTLKDIVYVPQRILMTVL